jgi:hypothetical protein
LDEQRQASAVNNSEIINFAFARSLSPVPEDAKMKIQNQNHSHTMNEQKGNEVTRKVSGSHGGRQSSENAIHN